MDRFRLGASNWKDQFSDAVTIPDNCSVMTKVICIITIPWKVIFALVPPTTYNNGVATFFCSLGMITFVTILIGDFASLFGCALGLKDAITAITFVALGTSLPDTFASTSAAIGDETADNSVGNVTGSNSVNVFLGLGTPWFIASMYWMYWGATPQWIARVSFIFDPNASTHTHTHTHTHKHILIHTHIHTHTHTHIDNRHDPTMHSILPILTLFPSMTVSRRGLALPIGWLRRAKWRLGLLRHRLLLLRCHLFGDIVLATETHWRRARRPQPGILTHIHIHSLKARKIRVLLASTFRLFSFSPQIPFTVLYVLLWFVYIALSILKVEGLV
jgi:hypothetical protein